MKLMEHFHYFCTRNISWFRIPQTGYCWSYGEYSEEGRDYLGMKEMLYVDTAVPMLQLLITIHWHSYFDKTVPDD